MERNSILNYIKNNGILLLFLIGLIAFSILPYGVTEWYDADENYVWQSTYFYDQMLFIVLYAPLFFLVPAMLLLKPGKIKTAIMYIVVAFSFCCSALAFLSLMLVAQDFMPDYGTLVAATFGPMMFVHLILEQRKKNRPFW